jgi:predicted metal-dependent enzyme (double-stranded beta helix superfamily)
MVYKLIAVAVIGAAVYGQEAKPVIDNERVTVWDVTWTKGQTNPARGHALDAVVMWYTGDKAGQAFFSPKSDRRAEEGGANERSLVIELKDFRVPPLENKTGYPLAFPRPHVKKLLENDRVVVWSYRWNPGEPTPMHYHDKDVVLVYLEDTALTSTTPDGAKTLNEYKAFQIRFNKRDRTHSELLERGTGSALMMELK